MPKARNIWPKWNNRNRNLPVDDLIVILHVRIPVFHRGVSIRDIEILDIPELRSLFGIGPFLADIHEIDILPDSIILHGFLEFLFLFVRFIGLHGILGQDIRIQRIVLRIADGSGKIVMHRNFQSNFFRSEPAQFQIDRQVERSYVVLRQIRQFLLYLPEIGLRERTCHRNASQIAQSGLRTSCGCHTAFFLEFIQAELIDPDFYRFRLSIVCSWLAGVPLGILQPYQNSIHRTDGRRTFHSVYRIPYHFGIRGSIRADPALVPFFLDGH